VRGQVAAVLDRDPRVSVLMQDQRRHAEEAQHMTHVDAHIHLVQRVERPRAAAITEYPRPGPDLFFLSGRETRSDPRFDASGREEIIDDLPVSATPFPLGGPEQVVRRPHGPCHAPV
jgi:hypothetical protein